MNLPPDIRAALMRFAAFEADKMQEAPDSTLLMLEVARGMLIARDPKRMATIATGAAYLVAASHVPPAPTKH